MEVLLLNEVIVDEDIDVIVIAIIIVIVHTIVYF